MVCRRLSEFGIRTKTISQLLSSYCIEASLVTLYCLAAAVAFIRRRRNDGGEGTVSGRSATIIDRVLDAFRGSTYELFTGAVFLALGVQITVLYLQAVGSAANTSTTLLLSGFSFFPLAVLLPVITGTGRRKWLQTAVLVTLFIITVAAFVVCVNNAQTEDAEIRLQRELCPGNYLSGTVVAVGMFPVVGMMWIPPLFGLCLSCVLCLYRCNRSKMWQANGLQKVVKAAALLYSVVSFIMMWALLVLLLLFYSNTKKAGLPSDRNDWSFGQFLVLTTCWGPLLVEFACILICESLGNSPLPIPLPRDPPRAPG
jgi:hypothetical protein